MTASFHSATFELLGTRPRTTTAALGEIESAEQRLGVRLPPSVREWYSLESALSVLSEHSNDDPLIPVRDFALTDSTAGRLIPIRWENQGVCTWAILLDGSDDPPVLVDVDSNGLARSRSSRRTRCACAGDARGVPTGELLTARVEGTAP